MPIPLALPAGVLFLTTESGSKQMSDNVYRRMKADEREESRAN